MSGRLGGCVIAFANQPPVVSSGCSRIQDYSNRGPKTHETVAVLVLRWRTSRRECRLQHGTSATWKRRAVGPNPHALCECLPSIQCYPRSAAYCMLVGHSAYESLSILLE